VRHLEKRGEIYEKWNFTLEESLLILIYRVEHDGWNIIRARGDIPLGALLTL
jgi:hypothetical protein